LKTLPALEILKNSDGRAKFFLHHRFIKSTRNYAWATVHTSGIYADAASAEADGFCSGRTVMKAVIRRCLDIAAH
jgi:hypothetical protein